MYRAAITFLVLCVVGALPTPLQAQCISPNSTFLRTWGPLPGLPPSFELVLSGSEGSIEPEFIVFFSYFGAMRRSTAQIDADLNYLHSKGVRGIRILPNWLKSLNPHVKGDDTLFKLSQAPGFVDQAVYNKMKEVILCASGKGMAVDVSFVRDIGDNLDATQYATALGTVTQMMKNDQLYNVLIDVHNEASLFASPAEILGWIAAVKNADPNRKVTVSIESSGAFPGVAPPSPPNPPAWGSIEENVAQAATTYGLSVATIHDGRDYQGSVPIWHRQTGLSVNTAGLNDTRRVNRMRCNGMTKPIYFQEPERYKAPPKKESANAGHTFLEAAIRAKVAGAAAWTFHTEAGFCLTGDVDPSTHCGNNSLEQRLSQPEKDFLNGINAGIPSASLLPLWSYSWAAETCTSP